MLYGGSSAMVAVDQDLARPGRSGRRLLPGKVLIR